MYPRPLRLIAAEDLVYYTARLLAAILCRECCFLQEAVKSVNGRLIKRQFEWFCPWYSRKKGSCLHVYVHYLRIRTWEMVGNILYFGSAIHNEFYTSDWYGKTTYANVMHTCATCHCKATFSVLVGWLGFLNGPCLAKVKSAQAKNDWYSASHLQRTSISLFYNYKSNILNVTANISEKNSVWKKWVLCVVI